MIEARTQWIWVFGILGNLPSANTTGPIVPLENCYGGEVFDTTATKGNSPTLFGRTTIFLVGSGPSGHVWLGPFIVVLAFALGFAALFATWAHEIPTVGTRFPLALIGGRLGDGCVSTPSRSRVYCAVMRLLTAWTTARHGASWPCLETRTAINAQS